MKIVHTVASILTYVGAVNWGLVGVGHFFGGNWSVVNLLLGSLPVVEALVYVLVGASAVYLVVTHKSSCRMCDVVPSNPSI